MSARKPDRENGVLHYEDPALLLTLGLVAKMVKAKQACGIWTEEKPLPSEVVSGPCSMNFSHQRFVEKRTFQASWH